MQNAFPVSFPLAPGSFLRSFSDGGVEQKQARWAHNPEVAGSSPVTATRTFFMHKGFPSCYGTGRRQ